MILKPRQKSITLQKYEALLPRLLENHPKKDLIQSDYSKLLAGYKGEKNTDYPLSFLDEKRYFILHDIRLFDGKHFFQIDTLILSQFYIAIAEIKNYSGVLTFDPVFDQLIRTIDEKEESLPNPIVQVKRQIHQFKQWLKNNKFPIPPIEPLVIVANDRAVIKMQHNNNEIPRIVTLLSTFPYKISTLENQFSKEIFALSEIKKITRRLLKQHSPNEKDILTLYSLSYDDILRGIECETCHSFSMKRVSNKWVCETCNFVSKDAHIKALKDYLLLFGEEVTNLQGRQFLNLESRHIMKRIFKSMNLNHSAAGKNTKYYLEFTD